MSSYLGRGLEQVDNISKLDNITFNGGTTYALTKDSAAFTPISSNAILISIDGVVQQGNFSVSGTNIVFNFSPTGSNTCNWILHMGTGVAFTPADSSVTKDKANFISTSSAAGLQIKGDGTTDGTLQLNCSQNSHGVKLKSPAHSAGQSYTLTLPTTSPAADKMIQTDGSGNLSFVDAPSGGLTRVGGSNVTGQNLTDLPFDNVFSATFNTYYVTFRVNMVANSSQLWLRMRDGSGFKTNSNYKFILYGENWSETESSISSSGGDDKFRLTGGLNSADDDTGAYGYLYFYRPFNSGKVTEVTMGVTEKDESYVITSRVGAGSFQNTASCTGFGFIGSNQNIEDCDVTVYGVNQS